MSNVTQLLKAIDEGDPRVADQLLPLVYEELRKLAAARMAQEKPGHTLQPTALVHEAWIRLVDPADQKTWNGRSHFFGAAAEAMRRILVESARRKARLRHGGDMQRADVDQIDIAAPTSDDRLVQVSEALDELEQEAPEAARIVKLRYFAGLTQEQVAETLGISLRTAERQWTWAKAWLFQRIRAQDVSERTD
jgi:RNA polymerase sigma factor (TIGR02999 family)